MRFNTYLQVAGRSEVMVESGPLDNFLQPSRNPPANNDAHASSSSRLVLQPLQQRGQQGKQPPNKQPPPSPGPAQRTLLGFLSKEPSSMVSVDQGKLSKGPLQMVHDSAAAAKRVREWDDD